MFHPVSLVPVHGVIVSCCLDCVLAFIVSGVVKLLSSSPSCLNPKKKKKKMHFCFACSRNDGVVTYGIRAGFNPRLGITTTFVDMILIIMLLIELTCIHAGNHG
jgi:hypothetical protein